MRDAALNKRAVDQRAVRNQSGSDDDATPAVESTDGDPLAAADCDASQPGHNSSTTRAESAATVEVALAKRGWTVADLWKAADQPPFSV